MLQLGNLAVVCAKRPGVLLQIMDGKVTVFSGCGPGRKQVSVDWQDNTAIENLIKELNFGSLSKEALNEQKH